MANFEVIPIMKLFWSWKDVSQSFEIWRIVSCFLWLGPFKFNTVIDMLGDKNMLVFLEAIKTVELLSDILGPLQMIKQAKAKILINLLASKYGETKTAVIAAVDKSILAMVRREVFSPVQFVDMCIN